MSNFNYFDILQICSEIVLCLWFLQQKKSILGSFDAENAIRNFFWSTLHRRVKKWIRWFQLTRSLEELNRKNPPSDKILVYKSRERAIDSSRYVMLESFLAFALKKDKNRQFLLNKKNSAIYVEHFRYDLKIQRSHSNHAIGLTSVSQLSSLIMWNQFKAAN